jgi:HAD superfamily hydrolase (TIGR01509 family)
MLLFPHQKSVDFMINWDDIDTVLLDMDGTLLDLHYDNFFWMSYLPKHYAKFKRLKRWEAWAEIEPMMQSERGKLSWYSLDYWTEQLGIDIPTLKREIAHMIEIRPFVVEFLTSLREHGKTLYLVTNAHNKTLAIKVEQTGIDRWFDRIIVSHDLGLPKEDPEFWHRMRALHPFDPARSLLIDDTESVLASAKQAGIAHLLTLLQPDSHKDLRSETLFRGIHHFDEILPAGQQ